MEIRTFAPARPRWTFTAVDPVSEMITATMASARKLGADARVTAVVGNVRDIPAETAFDAATIVNVLHFLPDDGAKTELLTSVTRRVKPNSPVVLFDLYGDTASPHYAEFRRVWRRYQAHQGLLGQELNEPGLFTT